MNLKYEKSFYKNIKKIKNKEVKDSLFKVIVLLKNQDKPYNISALSRLRGYSHYYRMRIGNYRLELKIINNDVSLIRFLHRKDIYRYFP